MKIYARQIAPEYQESPLFYGEEFFPDDIIVTGNRHYNSHTIPVYDRILDCYDDAAEYLEELQRCKKGAAYKNVTEIIHDYFPALEYREKPYNTRDIHRIRVCLELYGTRKYYEGDYILEMLEAITGETWSAGTIRGCCQDEWQDIYYPVKNWSAESIARFECEYFNTGSEWIIHDGNTEPETPEDIDGCSCYCIGWNDLDIRKEIAAAAGFPDAAVILYKHTGYTKTAQYTEVK